MDGFESDRAVNQAESYMGKVFSDNSKYSIKSNYNSGMAVSYTHLDVYKRQM